MIEQVGRRGRRPAPRDKPVRTEAICHFPHAQRAPGDKSGPRRADWSPSGMLACRPSRLPGGRIRRPRIDPPGAVAVDAVCARTARGPVGTGGGVGGVCWARRPRDRSSSPRFRPARRMGRCHLRRPCRLSRLSCRSRSIRRSRLSRLSRRSRPSCRTRQNRLSRLNWRIRLSCRGRRCPAADLNRSEPPELDEPVERSPPPLEAATPGHCHHRRSMTRLAVRRLASPVG